MFSLKRYLLSGSILLSGLYFNACRPPSVPEKGYADSGSAIDSCISLIQSGDLILRCGRDEISKFFCQLNTRDKKYSHCGTAVKTDSGVYIYHITGDADNVTGRMIYEPVFSFAHPKKNSKWAIVRYDFDSVTRWQFCKKVASFYTAKTVFDEQFDLQSDDKMYCSEMVYKAMLAATQDSLFILPTISVSGKPYIAVDNLSENKHCRTICEITY